MIMTIFVDWKIDNLKIISMKKENLMSCTTACTRYEAPSASVVEVCVERGFEVSGNDFGLGDGTSYDEEDVNW